MKNPIILLDVDGVLADFVGAALKAHGRDGPVSRYDFWQDWGITADTFWEPLRGRDFWRTIRPYPWAKVLLAELRKLGTVYIATAPNRDPECIAAKLWWLKRHLNVLSDDVMCGKHKWLMASPSTILIDDGEHNVSAFVAAGGKAILFPQPYNANHLVQSWQGVLRAVAKVSQETPTRL